MSAEHQGKFVILDGYPADVIAISAEGKIGRDAYAKTLIPLIEERLRAEGKVNLLYVIGEAFEGYTAGAMWDDTKLGLMHLTDFGKIAVVTDIEWIRLGIKMFAPMIRADVRLFHLAEQDDARTWITAYGQKPDGGPGVAVDRKVTTSRS